MENSITNAVVAFLWLWWLAWLVTLAVFAPGPVKWMALTVWMAVPIALVLRSRQEQLMTSEGEG